MCKASFAVTWDAGRWRGRGRRGNFEPECSSCSPFFVAFKSPPQSPPARDSQFCRRSLWSTAAAVRGGSEVSLAGRDLTSKFLNCSEFPARPPSYSLQQRSISSLSRSTVAESGSGEDEMRSRLQAKGSRSSHRYEGWHSTDLGDKSILSRRREQ